MTKYPISECNKITELCSGAHYMQNEYPKEAFDHAVMHAFEDTEMPLPCGYDAYLRMAFGDYMQLPPEDKRKPHHDAEFFDLNTPCAQYKGVKYCVEEPNRQSNDER